MDEATIIENALAEFRDMVVEAIVIVVYETRHEAAILRAFRDLGRGG